MQLKVSSKYQVIIPKAARQKMDLQRGSSYMTVKRVTDNEITFIKSPVANSDIEKYAGILKSAKNTHPVENLRRMRDKDWA